ncbi:5-oxoprolinase subunit PxpB [Paenibacillus doosanensis]|uniref:Kinase A inhibitor n=1 Tax=Paenibacillus konkukensis TaxID=2020716 RepID=A0ABY4RS90_9BACL|nr:MULTISPECIES: 5-oxoprolinase subunit PxpB [Paenibacillus]MCS7461189.1 5-oxoprolinase subunit PxpB [Paenibacillus doosanensis]UQZ85426.1 Kinase A inhibitor [Paenibacillus konkukensis]
MSGAERWDPQYEPLGDSAVVIRLGDKIDTVVHRRVKALTAYLHACPFPGMIECVPSFVSVAVYYDPVQVLAKQKERRCGWTTLFQTVCGLLAELIERIREEEAEPEAPRIVRVPVYYGGETGPDLDDVARHCGLEAEEVIRLHSGGTYTVYMIGFAPGFPYLGGMPERIAAPRRHTPRPLVPAGSVGIAGAQTGVYSVATPGGWQIIGRTPLRLFRPEADPPSFLRAGDVVRFYPISLKQYEEFIEEGLGER